MRTTRRPVPFVLISSNHGTLIVNRNAHLIIDENRGQGAAYQLLRTSSLNQPEVEFAIALLDRRRRHFGDGVMAIDCGANIGIHTVEWARSMHGWGEVISFEPQEKIYYALAGNVAINNCLNVTARNCAVGSHCATIEVPQPNYLIPSSYGSLELRQSQSNEYIGQEIDYKKTKSVPLVSIDSMCLARLDLLKIDVEGMEEEVLEGAESSIKQHRPVMIIEIIKSDRQKIEQFLRDSEYKIYPMGINLLAIHAADPVNNSIRYEPDRKLLGIV